jgi:hypothetical protein
VVPAFLLVEFVRECEFEGVFGTSLTGVVAEGIGLTMAEGPGKTGAGNVVLVERGDRVGERALVDPERQARRAYGR